MHVRCLSQLLVLTPIVEWSEELPLAAALLKPLSGRACEEVTSDLWQSGGLRCLHRFLPPLQIPDDNFKTKEGIGFYVAFNSIGHIAMR